jgi:hypothetical protein
MSFAMQQSIEFSDGQLGPRRKRWAVVPPVVNKQTANQLEVPIWHNGMENVKKQ